jgi:hypothetical protein
MLILNVFRREGYEGDEGFYGVTALNMLQSPTYILRPSYYPAGDFATEKDAFAHPPFNSYLYAAALWLGRGSLAGLEVLNALSFALLLFFTWRSLSLFQTQAGIFAVLLLAASPAVIKYYSQLEAEPLMTTFGVIALYCGLRGRFFLSGLCLGTCFALKLWLFGPLALAVVVALMLGGRRPAAKWLLLFAIGAILPAALHLLSTAIFYPQDLGFWLKNIYFGIFTNSGISGGKLSAAAVPSAWVHPWWYYAAALYRDHFFLVPVILLGLRSLMRDEQLNGRFLWIVCAGIAGLLPLSLMKVKEPNYVLSCAIFLYLLAGACLAALARRIAMSEEIDALSKRFGTVAVLGLLVLFPLAYLRGIKPDEITSPFVIAHSLTFGAFLAVFWCSQRKERPVFEWSVYAACAIALLTVFSYNYLTRYPRDKTIARLIEPYVQNNAPNTLSVIASNFKSYQFYTFRRGCYWEELPLKDGPEVVLARPEFQNVRAFIIDPADQQGQALTPWLDWLQTRATEKTAELNHRLGPISGFRLFVPLAVAADGSRVDRALALTHEASGSITWNHSPQSTKGFYRIRILD